MSAVRGRLRFEILRRDDHACRYCGATAPDVKLTIDHVVPASLGGTDAPANLVTACTSCNGGKASIAPDSAIVADVAADATRYAAALRAAIQEREEAFGALREAVSMFDVAWSQWSCGGLAIDRTPDWANTVERWVIGGLTVDELAAKIPLAMRSSIRQGGEWRYFCGVGWAMLTELQERARDIAGFGDEAPMDAGEFPGECTECTGPALDGLCAECSYHAGWRAALARLEEHEAA